MQNTARPRLVFAIVVTVVSAGWGALTGVALNAVWIAAWAAESSVSPSYTELMFWAGSRVAAFLGAIAGLMAAWAGVALWAAMRRRGPEHSGRPTVAAAILAFGLGAGLSGLMFVAALWERPELIWIPLLGTAMGSAALGWGLRCAGRAASRRRVSPARGLTRRSTTRTAATPPDPPARPVPPAASRPGTRSP